MAYKRFTQEYIEQYFKEHGCELLDIYVQTHKKVKYMCSCGNISTISFNDFKYGKRCSNCANIKRSKSHMFSEDHVREYFKSYGCELLGTYTGTLNLVSFKCKCGNISQIRFHDFKKRYKCCKLCGYKRRSKENHYLWNDDRNKIKLKKQLHNRANKLVRRFLKLKNKIKQEKSFELLGYTQNQLLEHLQSFPQWEGLYSSSKWHLDHIFPVKAFVEYDILDIKIINALDNLQPLSVEENLSKSDTYNKQDFILYLFEHGINYGEI